MKRNHLKFFAIYLLLSMPFAYGVSIDQFLLLLKKYQGKTLGVAEKQEIIKAYNTITNPKYIRQATDALKKLGLNPDDLKKYLVAPQLPAKPTPKPAKEEKKGPVVPPIQQPDRGPILPPEEEQEIPEIIPVPIQQPEEEEQIIPVPQVIPQPPRPTLKPKPNIPIQQPVAPQVGPGTGEISTPIVKKEKPAIVPPVVIQEPVATIATIIPPVQPPVEEPIPVEQQTPSPEVISPIEQPVQPTAKPTITPVEEVFNVTISDQDGSILFASGQINLNTNNENFEATLIGLNDQAINKFGEELAKKAVGKKLLNTLAQITQWLTEDANKPKFAILLKPSITKLTNDNSIDQNGAAFKNIKNTFGL